MKRTVFLVLGLYFWHFAAFAQSLTKTMTYAGEARSYRIYIPQSYDSTQPVPLVLALHGLGDNATNFQGVGFNPIADTANFIAVYPNALPDPLLQSSGWNTGMHPLNSRDDAGFLAAMLDTIMSHYAIDSNRVYSCGFSLGGFMTYRIACEMGDRLAAVASVAGSLPAPSIANCYSGKPMPVLHIHGTADQVIPYPFGVIYGVVTNLGADSTTRYWATQNACDITYVHDSLPDTKNDGFTFEKYTYGSCNDSSEVVLIKVNGMDHDWPSSGNDVNATKEIWNFFRKHSNKATPPIDTTATGIDDMGDVRIISDASGSFQLLNLFPKTKVMVTDVAGREFYHEETEGPVLHLKIKDILSGIYFITLMNEQSTVVRKFYIRQ